MTPATTSSDTGERGWLLLLIFLTPALIYLFVWKGGPLLYTVYLSFTDWSPLQPNRWRYVGFDNYLRVYSDPAFWKSLRLTVFFTVVTTAIELVLGLMIALLVEEEFRGKSLLRTAILIPIVIAPAVVGVIWYILLHSTIGPLNYLFVALGLPSNWLGNPNIAIYAVMLSDIWHWTPFMFLLLLSRLQVIPRDIYEAAAVDGANWWQMLRLIKLPMLGGTILVALVLRSMDAFRIFDEIVLMTGGGPGDATSTTTMLVYQNAFRNFRMGYSSALVVVILAMTMAVYAIYMRYVTFNDSESNTK